MGLLLMQFEYNRAKQKQTVLEHEGIRLNQRHEQYTKRIGKITELFNKKKTALDSKYTRIKSELSSQLNTASANGTIGGTNVIGSIFSSISSGVLAGIAIAGETDIKNIVAPASATTKTAEASSIASQQAAIVAQLQSALQVVLDQLKEAELAELEESEDAQTAPIAEKDTEMQSKIAVNDTLTTMADERVEKAKARLQQVTKDSVAHYGLS